MPRLYTYSKFIAVTLVMTVMCGCEVFQFDTVDSRRQREAAVAAVYWDGPRIRPGIALVIQVGTSSTPPATFNTLVDGNGEITLPLLLQEPIACEGLTLDALKKKLVKAYSQYYRQPQITVTFAPYDGHGVSPWGTITVLGEVGMPGPVNVPSTSELTITKVLQMAGGVKPFGDKEAIQVTRCDKDGMQHRTKVDIKEIGKDGRPDMDMKLLPGDVVWVPEVWY